MAKRQITEAEKQQVLERQGLKCFIDDHPVAQERRNWSTTTGRLVQCLPG